jgi:hypothetical protein
MNDFSYSMAVHDSITMLQLSSFKCCISAYPDVRRLRIRFIQARFHSIDFNIAQVGLPTKNCMHQAVIR